MKKYFPSAVLCAAMITGCLTDSSETKIRLRNRTYSTIDVVYIADCASTSWGYNRLSGKVIPPNSDQSFSVAAGCWDVHAEFTGSGQVEFNAIEVSSGTFTLTATN